MGPAVQGGEDVKSGARGALSVAGTSDNRYGTPSGGTACTCGGVGGRWVSSWV